MSPRSFAFVFFFSALMIPAGLAADFCESRSPGKLGETIENLSANPEMRLAFRNQGGLINGGVCWWHSRFQRAALYLAIFDEKSLAPTRAEARRLIRALVTRKDVVVIPGFRDLATFSKEYREEIQRELNAWQIRDSLINQAYLRGLSGRARFRHAGRMKARLDRVYGKFVAARTRGEMLFVTLQMRGIASHASLIRAMSTTGDGGYRIAMIDSNFPDRQIEYAYRPGDLELTPANVKLENYTSVPYVGFTRDLTRIHRAIETYCAKPSLR